MNPVLASAESIAFGRFRMLPRRRVLLADDEPIKIGGRAFDLLMVLIESPGAVVSKDDLMARVWPGRVVTETNLQTQILALRHAFGAERNLIRTVAGRGYQFTGEIRMISPGLDKHVAATPLAAGHAVVSPTNLPQPVSEPIGREAEVEEVLSLVRAGRLVTLTGAGGIGKTRLALAVARRLLPHFPDGVWLAEFSPLSDHGLVPAVIAAAVGIELPGGVITAQGVAQALVGRRLLIVLDTCEHVIDAAALMAEAVLRAGSVASMIATSREPLRAEGEQLYPVPPLAVPAEDAENLLEYGAVRLFVERARAAEPDLTLDRVSAATVAAICRRLDGIPLAIEMAATRLAALGVEELAKRLDDRFQLLTEGRRTALPRHQTLRATLDWSHELLPEPERVLLRRLAVFAGAFSLEAAGAVVASAEIASPDVVDGISSLVAKSLVVAEVEAAIPRYRLLDTTRAYAIEKLAKSGECEQLARRHAEYYRDLFERAEIELESRPTAAWLGDVTEAWMEVHGPVINEVRAALDWAHRDRGDPTLAVDLTAAATPIWIHHLLIDECRERIEQAIALIAKGVVRRDTRRDMLLFAKLAFSHMESTGEASKIDGAWSRVADLAEELDDGEYRLRGLWGLWIGRYFNRDYRGALQVAMRLATLPDVAVEAADRFVGERVLGVTLHILGDQPRARVHLENMLRGYVAPPGQVHIKRYLFDQNVAARTFYARILWLQGFPDQAVAVGNRALDEAMALNHDFSLLYALAFGMCPLSLECGDFDVTEELISRMFQRAEAFRPMRVWGTCYEGILRIRKNDTTSGLSLLHEGLEGFVKSGFQGQYLAFLGNLALGLFNAGAERDAIATIDEALDYSEKDSDRWYIAELMRIKGELTLRQNEPEAAGALFKSSLDWSRKQNALSWELRTATSFARLLKQQGRGNQARELLEPIYLRFTEGFATKDLVEARSLLTGLGVTPAA